MLLNLGISFASSWKAQTTAGTRRIPATSEHGGRASALRSLAVFLRGEFFCDIVAKLTFFYRKNSQYFESSVQETVLHLCWGIFCHNVFKQRKCDDDENVDAKLEGKIGLQSWLDLLNDGYWYFGFFLRKILFCLTLCDPKYESRRRHFDVGYWPFHCQKSHTAACFLKADKMLLSLYRGKRHWKGPQSIINYGSKPRWFALKKKNAIYLLIDFVLVF